MTGVRAAAAPLASPAFRRHLAGQLPSVTCSWAQVITLSWVVVELDRRALGLVVALQFLPSLVLGPWFGAVADQHDRRRLLMLAESGLGLVAAGYAVASASGALTMPLICSLAAAWRIINAIAGLAGVGLAWSLVLVSVLAVLQSADPRMLGRVMSLFAVVLLGGTSAAARSPLRWRPRSGPGPPSC